MKPEEKNDENPVYADSYSPKTPEAAIDPADEADLSGLDLNHLAFED